MTYKDKFNFIHDKQVVKGEGSSNNPLIYSAIYKEVTGEIYDYRDIFFRFMVDQGPLGIELSITRTYNNDSPTSLDEIIGGIYLGLIDVDLLKNHHWRWYDTLNMAPRLRVFQAAVYCAGKHRNFFKSEYGNVPDLHPLAYWVPWHVQFYAKKKSNKYNFTPFLAIMFYLWLISVFLKKNYIKKERQTTNISQKNIAALILLDTNNRLIKLINYKKNLNEYFEKGHPIREGR